METTPTRPVRVLVVDDEPTSLKALEALLREKGWEVIAIDSVGEAIQGLAAEDFDVVLLDIELLQRSGMELLIKVRHQRRGVAVIVMTGHATVDVAQAAVKDGAYGYVIKPFEDAELVARAVSNAAERKAHFDRIREESDPSDEELVGNSVAMREVMRMIDAVAYSSAAVLVHGEGCTGKKVVARALHAKSPRRSRPFVAFNCGALTEAQLESELFGHVKGAFTGALRDQKGLFEAADGGTIFLNEIGDIPPATQVRLLHLLQEGELKRVGSAEAIHVDVRVIAATHRDLPKLVKAGRFREDLCERLNAIAIPVPPLRDRIEDVPFLAHHFLRRYADRLGKKVRTLSPEAIGLLCGYRWPGRFREFENAIERAVVLCRGDTITPGDLPPAVFDRTAPLARVLPTLGEDAAWLNQSYSAAKEQALRRFEKRYVEATMRACDNNVSAAAHKIGMDRSDFEQVLRKYRSDLGPDDVATNSEEAAWLDQGYAVAKEQALRWFEKSYVEALMRACDNNISAAARKAGMDRSNFKRVLRKYRSDVGPDDGDVDAGPDVSHVSV